MQFCLHENTAETSLLNQWRAIYGRTEGLSDGSRYLLAHLITRGKCRTASM